MGIKLGSTPVSLNLFKSNTLENSLNNYTTETYMVGPDVTINRGDLVSHNTKPFFDYVNFSEYTSTSRDVSICESNAWLDNDNSEGRNAGAFVATFGGGSTSSKSVVNIFKIYPGSSNPISQRTLLRMNNVAASGCKIFSFANPEENAYKLLVMYYNNRRIFLLGMKHDGTSWSYTSNPQIAGSVQSATCYDAVKLTDTTILVVYGTTSKITKAVIVTVDFNTMTASAGTTVDLIASSTIADCTNVRLLALDSSHVVVDLYGTTPNESAIIGRRLQLITIENGTPSLSDYSCPVLKDMLGFNVYSRLLLLSNNLFTYDVSSAAKESEDKSYVREYRWTGTSIKLVKKAFEVDNLKAKENIVGMAKSDTTIAVLTLESMPPRTMYIYMFDLNWNLLSKVLFDKGFYSVQYYDLISLSGNRYCIGTTSRKYFVDNSTPSYLVNGVYYFYWDGSNVVYHNDYIESCSGSNDLSGIAAEDGVSGDSISIYVPSNVSAEGVS